MDEALREKMPGMVIGILLLVAVLILIGIWVAKILRLI